MRTPLFLLCLLRLAGSSPFSFLLSLFAFSVSLCAVCVFRVCSVFEDVLFSSASSVARICSILNLSAGARISAARQRALQKRLEEWEAGEAAEAEEMIQQLNQKEQQIMRSSGSKGKGGATGEGALALIMQNRAKERAKTGESFFAALEAKYSGGAGAGTAAGKKKGGAAAASPNGTGKRAGSKRKSAAAAASADAMSEGEAEEEEEEEVEQGAQPSEEEFAATQARMQKALKEKAQQKQNGKAKPSPAKKSRK